jgi:ankyrin repeat protein
MSTKQRQKSKAKQKNNLNQRLLESFECGKKGQVAALLRKGADVNTRDEAGNTPLVLASLKGYASISRLLLDHGADADLQNKLGYDAHNIALIKRHRPVIEVLEEFDIKKRGAQSPAFHLRLAELVREKENWPKLRKLLG